MSKAANEPRSFGAGGAKDVRVVKPLKQHAYTIRQIDNPSSAQRILELLQKLTLDLSVMFGVQ